MTPEERWRLERRASINGDLVGRWLASMIVTIVAGCLVPLAGLILLVFFVLPLTVFAGRQAWARHRLEVEDLRIAEERRAVPDEDLRARAHRLARHGGL